MSSIDERIVQMKFNNGQFEQGIKQTSSSLDSLKQKLRFDGVKSGLSELGSSMNSLSLSNLSSSVENVASKFNALNAIAFTTLANITNQAIAAGTQLIKSLTIDPISSGLKEYEMNLTGIQTILANTKSKGENLKTVGAALDELNVYSDKTIYNFGQMVQGIKTLTTSGADLTTSVNTVKGFANVAALAGVGAEQMSSALQFGLNQAITKGKMLAQDWMSLETAGIAGEGFKNAIMETARVNGVAVDSIISKAGSFRESLRDGWLTADILQQTLAKYTGEMSDAQLKALGYTDKQIKSIQATAAEAVKSATKVKTVSQLISTLQEAAQSGWSKSWTFLFGDLNEAIDLFTNMSDVIGGMIGRSADARNKMLGDWKALGGRTAAIEALGNVFKSLMSIFTAISDAYKEIFPPKTGKDLFNITESFRKFTEKLLLNKTVLTNLKNTFKGLFAILDIVWMIVKGVFGVFTKLLSPLAGVGGGVTTLTGGLGTFLVKIRDAIKYGTGLGATFEFIGNVLKAPIDFIKRLTDAMSANNGKANSWADVWKKIGDVFKAIWDWLKPGIDWFIGALAATKDALGGALKSFDFNSVLLILNTGLLGGGVVLISKFVNFIKSKFSKLGGGILTNIKDAFKELGNTMKTFQTQIKAQALMKIAIAIGILTVSILILSMIDIAKLGTALGAMTVMFTQLVFTMKALDKIGDKKTAGKMFIISAGLILLSTAMVIFAAAITILAKLSWEETTRGLISMSAALIIITTAAKSISKNVGQIVAASFGIFVMSTALTVLGLALKIFASLSWEDIGKGLTVLTATLGVLAIFSKVMGNVGTTLVSAFVLTAMAGALLTLAGVMKILATMSWEEIARGLTGLAGSMIILALGMKLMSSSLSGALGLIVAAFALTILAGAMKLLSTLSWEQVGIGLTVLAASLIILSGAMLLMSGMLSGAAALIIAATAIAILAPAMKLLGSLKWDQVGVGLAVLAAALLIIAGAGYLLIGALPGLIGLGVAVVLVGAGMLMAATAIMLFSVGLLALAGASTIGGAAILLLVTGLINLIPLLLQKVAEGIVAIARVIAASGTEFVNAMVTILTSIITAIAIVTPLLIKTIFDLLWTLISTLEQNVPRFVESGGNIIIAWLDGMAKKLPGIIAAGTNLVIAFIRGIGRNAIRLARAAAQTLLDFLTGLAQAIREYMPKIIAAGADIGMALIDGMTGGLGSKAKGLVDGVVGWAGDIAGNFADFFGIHSPSRLFAGYGKNIVEGLAGGLNDYASMAHDGAANVGQSAVDGLNKSITGINDTIVGNIDMNPTIRPVLDLSAIKKDSTVLDSLLTPSSMTVGTSYNQASSIASDKTATQQADTAVQQDSQTTGSTNISFIQNNTSPIALTVAELYRQTKNQISIAKGNLATA